MSELATSAGLPRPEIEELGDSVTVRFRSRGHTPPVQIPTDLTKQQASIVALLRRSVSGLALREVVARLGQETNERRVREDLAILKAKGVIEPSGRGRGARWRSL